MRPLLLLALLLAVPRPATGAAPKRPRLAVMDVRSVQGVQHGTATLITDVVVTELSGTRRFDVIGSSDIASLLGLEKQKQLLRCDEDSSCLAELGGALGVQYLVSGSVGLLGSRLRVSLTVQDVKQARVVARQARFCDANEDALARATEETVRALLSELDGAPLPVAAPDLKPAPPATSQTTSAATTAIAPPAPPPAKTTGPSRRAVALAVGGAGLALVAAGGTFDYLAYSAYQDQKAAAAAGDRVAYDGARSTGKSRALLANVFYGTGVAAVGAGAWLFLGAPSAPRVSVSPLEGGAVLSFAGVLP